MKLTAKSPKKKSRRTHVKAHHAVDAAPPVEPPSTPPEPPTTLDPDLAARVEALEERVKRLELRAEGAPLVADRRAAAPASEPFDAGPSEQADAGEETTGERAPLAYPVSSQDPDPWRALGYRLAQEGTHRLALGYRAARAAAMGGLNVPIEEEDQIAAWFAGVVDLAIRRGGVRAAEAVWYLLDADWHRDPTQTRPPRCPSIATIQRGSDDRDFIEQVRRAAPGYARTAIAGASDIEIDELRKMALADDAALEGYRPWGGSFLDDDGPMYEGYDDLEYARGILTARHISNAAACNAFGCWATGMAHAVIEHSIPPVYRLGAVAWLARVVLHDEGPIPDPERAILRQHEEAAEWLDSAEDGPSKRGRR